MDQVNQTQQTDQSSQTDLLSTEIAQRLEAYRHTYVDRRKKRKGDRFLGQWLGLKLAAAQNASERSALRTAKELDRFFRHDDMLAIEALSESLFEEQLRQNIFDSALQYQQACVDDPQYSSVFFAMKKLKPEQVAAKAGGEVYGLIIPFLLRMPAALWRDLMLVSIDKAYRTVFEGHAVNGMAVLSDKTEESLLDEFKHISEQRSVK